MILQGRLLVVVIGIMLIFPALLAAEETPADNMQFVIEKIAADKKLFIATNMQLTETEAKGFWPIYDQYQGELYIFRIKTKNLIEDYAASYEKMTGETATKLLGEFMTLESLRPEINKAYLPRLQAVLPDMKVLRYFQLENKINSALMIELAAKIPLIK